MELIIYIVIGIIYAIASANGYNGRYSRNNPNLRNRYGLLGMDDDFSLEIDPLERIRERYDRRLQQYYANNAPRTYLQNNFCELRLIKKGNDVCFYCKEKTNGRSAGRYFEVRGNSIHASTMWAIMDMEFKKRSDYDAVRRLYFSLNQSFETRGGLRYFSEPWFKRYPNFDNDFAQNEYCRLELYRQQNKSYVIICSEIWSKNPKRFMIIGNKYFLEKIISDFADEKNKFQTYSELFARYLTLYNTAVQELTNISNNTENQNSQKAEKPEKPKEPEPIKYIHVDFGNDNKPQDNPEEVNKDTKNDSGKIIIEEDTENLSTNNNIPSKKYDERHLDL